MESWLSPFYQYAGRATVTYDTEDCARKAMLHLDGGFIDGQKVWHTMTCPRRWAAGTIFT
jgi:hypothetical protein